MSFEVTMLPHVNAVLNAPGPLSIDDRDTERYIARMLCSFFGLPARAAGGPK